MEEKQNNGVNEPPATDYMAEFDLTQEQFNKIKEKYKRD